MGLNKNAVNSKVLFWSLDLKTKFYVYISVTF